MRYLILLLFVIPLVSQSATVRGQTCTITDLKYADPGCCRSTMYACSDLTANVNAQSDLNKAKCCNFNPDCGWNPSQSKCLGDPCPTKNIGDEKCPIVTLGASPQGFIARGDCKSNYTGKCNYRCQSGSWAKTSDTCKRKCSNETKNNCSLTASNHNQTSGSCANGYPNGSCSYTCNNGTWTQNNNTCSAPVGCNKGNSHCWAYPVAHGHSRRGLSQCRSSYTGTCDYMNCNNGSMVVTSHCKRMCSGTHNSTKCPSVGLFAHNTTQSRTCKSGYTGNCSYTCNNGTLGGSSAGCTNGCAAKTYSNNEIGRILQKHNNGWSVHSHTCSLPLTAHNHKVSCTVKTSRNGFTPGSFSNTISFKCNQSVFNVETRCPRLDYSTLPSSYQSQNLINPGTILVRLDGTWNEGKVLNIGTDNSQECDNAGSNCQSNPGVNFTCRNGTWHGSSSGGIDCSVFPTLCPIIINFGNQ